MSSGTPASSNAFSSRTRWTSPGSNVPSAAASIAPASASRSTQAVSTPSRSARSAADSRSDPARMRVAGHQRIVPRRCRTLRLVSAPMGRRDDQRAGLEAAGGADRARAQRPPDVHGHLALLRAPEPQGLGEAVPRPGRRGGRARRQDHGVPDRQRGRLRAAGRPQRADDLRLRPGRRRDGPRQRAEGHRAVRDPRQHLPRRPGQPVAAVPVVVRRGAGRGGAHRPRAARPHRQRHQPVPGGVDARRAIAGYGPPRRVSRCT